MRVDQAWLAGAREASKGAPQPLSFWGFLAIDPGTAAAQSRELRAACFASVLAMVRAQLELLQAHAAPALEACMAPVQRSLAAVEAHGAVSRALRSAAGALREEVGEAVAQAVAVRRPLVCPALVKKAAPRLLNPRFEVDFDKRRDYDPDRERSEYNEYKRLASKEKRCAARPLDVHNTDPAACCVLRAMIHECSRRACAATHTFLAGSSCTGSHAVLCASRRAASEWACV